METKEKNPIEENDEFFKIVHPDSLKIVESITSTAGDTVISSNEEKIGEINKQTENPVQKKEDFSHYKDYKNRFFDPEIHAVDEHGKPMLNGDGSLKILRKKNKIQRTIDSAREIAGIPKSDHESSKEEKAQAAAQAAAQAEKTRLELNAEVNLQLYFAGGSMFFSSAFVNDTQERRQILKNAFIEYEKATGKRWNPPPSMMLLSVLGMDIASQIQKEEECKSRIKSYVGAIDGFYQKIARKTKLKSFFSMFRKNRETGVIQPENRDGGH